MYYCANKQENLKEIRLCHVNTVCVFNSIANENEVMCHQNKNNYTHLLPPTIATQSISFCITTFKSEWTCPSVFYSGDIENTPKTSVCL